MQATKERRSVVLMQDRKRNPNFKMGRKRRRKDLETVEALMANAVETDVQWHTHTHTHAHTHA